MAAYFRMSKVAEGVEKTEIDVARKLDVMDAWGYHSGRPMPPYEARASVQTQRDQIGA